MDRYTFFDHEKWRIKLAGVEYSDFPAIDRLAAYEDTGLEPEEIQRILNEYGRGVTLRTSCAERLEIIKDIPIAVLREVAEQYQQAVKTNPPLTMEELRGMELDDWLWIEILEPSAFRGANPGSGQTHSDFTNGEALVEFEYETYGKTWLAYRRKPEETAI